VPRRPATVQPVLTRPQVLEAAVRLADEQGLSAVTMRALGEQLQVHASTLYHHVTNRDELLADMAEQLLASLGLPDRYTSWQDWVREIGEAFRRLAFDHPGAYPVITHGSLLGPTATQQSEAALDAFLRDRFDLRTAGYAVSIVSLAAHSLGLLSLPPAVRAVPDLSHITEDRFPHTIALGAEPADLDAHAELTYATLIAGLKTARRSGDRAR